MKRALCFSTWLAVLASCQISTEPSNGQQRCAPSGKSCTDGFTCRSDNFCWKDGTGPDVLDGGAGNAGGRNGGTAGTPDSGRGGDGVFGTDGGLVTGKDAENGDPVEPGTDASTHDGPTRGDGPTGDAPRAVPNDDVVQPDGILTNDGYYVTGNYSGYFFTSSDQETGGTSTIALANGSTGNFPLCVRGTIARVPNAMAYATYWGAVVGWNLNQGIVDGSLPNATTLSGTIRIRIDSRGSAPLTLRLAANAPNGTDSYCAALTVGANTISVVNLRSNCFDPMSGGVAYSNQLVNELAVQIVSSMDKATPFDFCITQLSIH